MDNLIETLKYVSANGHTATVKSLMDRGIDPSVENNYAIRAATVGKHFDVVDLLLTDERVDATLVSKVLKALGYVEMRK